MTEQKRVKYGLLLPHFGVYADRDRLLEGSKLAESYGFDSVWVRDHLIFEPHGEMEDPNRNFFDALITLTAIGAVTEKIELGTGSLIPFRHPLEVALSVATLTHLVGANRFICGYGAGTFDHEFEAVGIDPTLKRWDLVKGTAEVLKKVWTEDDVAFDDGFYKFDNVTIEPKPLGGPPPFWYCGNTPASVRRAVEYCEGWMPGRISLGTFRARVEALREQSEAAGRPMPTPAVIPPTSVEATRDLEGTLIAGSPEEVVEQCLKFEEAGCEHLVFDFRFKFDRFFEQIELLGQEVLPRLRKAREPVEV
jgi:alkanesulfonate monooxygenase SsuD/methylene tetrahydromethanopterin reductase-like flavin-dependent oxidoreductase (luciferase family)